ncbi:MAG: hypothetical protein E4H14_20375, partial [Candidatus Thorarchaeota archaeon]
MRQRYVVSLVLVMMFIFPILGNNDIITQNGNSSSQIPDSISNYVNSADPYSGTGPSLPVTLSGIATDNYGGTLQIDASTSDIHTITLADGWSGSNLQTTIDSLSVDISNALQNPSWDATHPEKWLVGATASRGSNVYVPDDWTLTKSEADDAHPLAGDWRLAYDTTGGYSGARFRFDVLIDSTSDPSDRIYYSQLVNAPYRELYSVDISFRYNVLSGYSTSADTYLFVQFAGIEKTFTVFESGDTTGTWLQATATITSTELQSITLPDALRLDIGMGTDSTGEVSPLQFRAILDDIDLTMNVRPFPEQIDLKVNGTAVIGAVSDSIYQYEPDNDTRDAWDLTGTGLDLSGFTYGSVAELSTRVYSATANDWTVAAASQSGIQFPMDIPQGAVITSAYLEVEPIGTVGNPTMRIYAAGFSSSGTSVEPFTVGLPQLEDRMTWVDSSIDWNPGTWNSLVRIRHRSPEIAPLIQSIVSEDNWTSGNFVCIMLDYMYSVNSPASNSYKGAYGSVYSEDEFPRLFVEYMIPEPEDTVYFMQYEKDITIDSSMTTAILN